jgi:FMN phosphatase YigB (HAD superfamily)
MLRQLDLQANEVVMIGNSMEADIAGAKPLGIKTIHVAFGANEDEDGPDPDATVSAVSEIIPTIEHIAASC